MASITGSVSLSRGTTYDLTALGTIDWMLVSGQRKAGANLITMSPTGAPHFSPPDAATLIYTDGTSPASGSTTGVYALNDVTYNDTFPAALEKRRVYIWAGQNDAVVTRLTATLSDGSASPLVISYDSGGNTEWTVWTIDYAAAANGTTLNVKIEKTSGSGLSAMQATAVMSAPVENNALIGGTGNVLFSPGNWSVGTDGAVSNNPGAYLRAIFTGSSIALRFDTSALVATLPEIAYRINNGPWTVATVAASMTLAVPSDTAAWGDKGGSFLEVIFKGMQQNNRGSNQGTWLKLTGIVLATGKTLAKPTARPLNMLVYGDSITEGFRNLTGGDAPAADDSRFTWAYDAARILGMEVGIVAFTGQGFTRGGDGGLPVFGSTWNQLLPPLTSAPRSFNSPVPDVVVINMGTNDSGGNLTSAATGVLNGLLAATPSSTKIVIIGQFDGGKVNEWQAAIAACTTPARVPFVSTSGWFRSGNSPDGTHPYGNEQVLRLAPLAAAAIKSAMNASVPLTSRTLALGLRNPDGTDANLTGLKWCVRATREGAAESNGTFGDASASLTAQTSIAPGGKVWVEVTGSDGTTSQAQYSGWAGWVAVP